MSAEPDWIGTVHPGELLREELAERQMTQADLARRCGLTPKHVSNVITGKAGIGLDAAYAIERVLGMSARMLIRLQADYDVTHHRRRGTPR